MTGEPLRYVFELAGEVRDYECDMHGIVNNAVYLNYLEHARRTFLRGQGLGFADLAADGVRLLMAEMTIKYRQSLVSGDSYVVRLALRRSGGLLVFAGDIFRTPDEVLCVQSVAKVAVQKHGRLTLGEPFDGLLAELA